MAYRKVVKSFTGGLQTAEEEVPQSQPLPGQIPNSAGGFAWKVDDWTRLDRFLILGSEGGSYYAAEQKLTIDNAEAVLRCIKEDGTRAINRIVDVSQQGRAPKNDPAIFALAIAISFGNIDTRRLAAEVVPDVCRIGTHLFHFAQYANNLRGWGPVLRRAIASWYDKRDVSHLALQVTKYKQRDKWSHRDLLRLSHPTGTSEGHKMIYDWVSRRTDLLGKTLVPSITGVESKTHPLALLAVDQHLAGLDLEAPINLAEVTDLIKMHNVPRELIPTELLKRPEVWEALLPSMPLGAMIRNLATMTRVGILKAMSAETKEVVRRITDPDALRKARVHPIQILAALLTYKSGESTRGSATWTPVAKIIDALDEAFYMSFGNVESTGKRWMLALDVSGSMSMEWAPVAGVPGLTPRMASAALAMLTARTEPDHMFTAFSTGIRELDISPKQRLDDVIRTISNLPFSGTDCALPMTFALKHKIPIDVFSVLTDSETWAGRIHPAEALRKYREEMGIPAKLIVLGMVSNEISIADPEDPGMLDVVGMDLATPQIMSDFAMGGFGEDRVQGQIPPPAPTSIPEAPETN